MFSKCKDGLKAQCDGWYERHIVDFKQIEGVVSVREYSITPGVARNAMGKDRLVVYVLSGDPAAVIARLGPAVAARKLLAPDASLFVMPFESVVVEQAFQ